MTPGEVERMYEALAAAIDAAGIEKEAVFLAKLSFLLAHRLGDPAEVQRLIASALQDL